MGGFDVHRLGWRIRSLPRVKHEDLDAEDGLAAVIGEDRARSLPFSQSFVRRCKVTFTRYVFFPFYFPLRIENNLLAPVEEISLSVKNGRDTLIREIDD